MSNFLMIDPTRIYQIKGEVSKVLCASGGNTVGVNRTIVTGITGKLIRVMGWIITPVTTALPANNSYFSLKSASGGTVIMNAMGLLAGVGGNDKLPIVDCGYAETLATGDGLFMDIVGSDLYWNIFYITYTP